MKHLYKYYYYFTNRINWVYIQRLKKSMAMLMAKMALMKYLFILLLLAGTAWGQDSIIGKTPLNVITPQYYHIVKSEPGTIELKNDNGIGMCYVFATKDDYRTQPITWGELEAYMEYCKNDSTMEICGRGQSWVLPMNPPIVKYEHYDTVYVHKQPTLPGLLLWKKKQ